MIADRFVFLCFLLISLLIVFAGCKPSCSCSERKFVVALLAEMTLQESDEEGYLEDSKCIYGAAKILEKLSGDKRHTKFGHWGEYYETKALSSDSLRYATILNQLTESELRNKIKDNYLYVIEILKTDCFDRSVGTECDCYWQKLKQEAH